MSVWKKMMRRQALLWALLLSVCLVLSGCGDANGGEIASIGEEIPDSAPGTMDGEELESVAEEIGSRIVDGLLNDDLGDGAEEDVISVEFGEEYSDRDHVALYLHLYAELPPNYITKNDARDLGWDSGKGNLWEIAPGKSIGGDRFGNREELLPEKKGRSYYECDINYEGGYRGGERIVYSNDGLVYYSEDHYENFELLYDGEGAAE